MNGEIMAVKKTFLPGGGNGPKNRAEHETGPGTGPGKNHDPAGRTSPKRQDLPGPGQGPARTSTATRPGSGIRKIASAILDLLYPPVCVHCGAVTGIADVLCPACWVLMRPITEPLCPVLGLPFEYHLGRDAMSAEAIANPPSFSRARSACIHNGVARTLVSRLKFGDRQEVAVFCARMMTGAGAELLGPNRNSGNQNEARENIRNPGNGNNDNINNANINNADADRPVLVPVPLHPRRQWQRRYNQSALLASAIARQCGLEMEPMLIRRIRATRPQVGLSARQRARNVLGAFEISGPVLAGLAGRRIVIIDDVITTGSTVRTISDELVKSGVEKIDVLSFSRVIKGADD